MKTGSKTRQVATAAVMILAALATAVDAEETASGKLDGRELLSSAARAGTPAPAGWTDRRSIVEIDAYAGGDAVRQRRAEILEQAGSSGELSTLTEFLGPADVNGTRVLELWLPGKSSDAWMWSPSTRRTRRMTDEQGQGDESPYYAVEPSYRDAQLIDALPRLAAGASEVKITGEEKIDGADAAIVELTLAEQKALPGGRYRVWISSADRVVRRIDLVDGSGEAKRRIIARSVQLIDGRPTPTELEISTPGTDRRTVYRRSDVRYDAGLPTRIWSLANLSKGR